jgi:hypothetical protein
MAGRSPLPPSLSKVPISYPDAVLVGLANVVLEQRSTMIERVVKASLIQGRLQVASSYESPSLTTITPGRIHSASDIGANQAKYSEASVNRVIMTQRSSRIFIRVAHED